jgi:hypothetical protein
LEKSEHKLRIDKHGHPTRTAMAPVNNITRITCGLEFGELGWMHIYMEKM